MEIIIFMNIPLSNPYLSRPNILANMLQIYTIPCKDSDVVFMGERGRDFETRIKDHKCAVRTGSVKSAVFNHVSESNQSTDWLDSQLLCWVK